MARLRYLQNARTGTAGTISKGTYPLQFYDDTAYIYGSKSGQLDLVATKVVVTGNLDVSGALSYGSQVVVLNQSLLETLTVGTSGTGYDVKFWGNTSPYYWEWDKNGDSNGEMILKGKFSQTGNATISGTLSVGGEITLSTVTVTGAIVTTFGTLAIDISTCTTGIDITAPTTGININGASTNALIISTTGSTATDGTHIQIGTDGAPITTATTALSVVKIYSTHSASGYNVPVWVTGRVTGTGYGTIYCVRGDAELTGTESTATTDQYIVGVHGRVKVTGTVDNTDVTIAGLFSQLLPGGTYTQVENVASLWVDNMLATNPSAGEVSMILITQNNSSATAVVDNVFKIQGGGGTQCYFAYLFNLIRCTSNGFVDGNLSTLKCKVDTYDRYIPLSTAVSSFTTAYPIVSTYSAGTAIDITTTTGTSGLQTFVLDSTFTGSAGNHNAMNVDMTIDVGSGGTTFTGDAGQFEAILDGTISGTCWVSGLHAGLTFADEAVYNANAGIYVALNALISADTSATLTSGHIAVLRLATNSAKDLTATSGICTFIYIDNDLQHSAGGMGSVMCLHSWNTPYLFDFPAGGYSQGIVDTNTSLGTACVGHIKILFNGTAAYINVTSDHGA